MDYYKYKVICEIHIALGRNVSKSVTGLKLGRNVQVPRALTWIFTVGRKRYPPKPQKIGVQTNINHGYWTRSDEGSEVTTMVYRFRFLTGLEAVAAAFERVRGNAPFLGPFCVFTGFGTGAGSVVRG